MCLQNKGQLSLLEEAVCKTTEGSSFMCLQSKVQLLLEERVCNTREGLKLMRHICRMKFGSPCLKPQSTAQNRGRFQFFASAKWNSILPLSKNKSVMRIKKNKNFFGINVFAERRQVDWGRKVGKWRGGGRGTSALNYIHILPPLLM